MKIKLILLFLLSASLMTGQNESIEETPSIREYGLDALFINRFLPLDNQIGRTSPYLFNYRRNNGNRFVRRNFDIDLSGVLNKSDSEPTRSTLNIDLDFLFGWGKRRKIYNNFYLYTGADFLVEPLITITDVKDELFINGMFEEIENKRSLYGLGVGIGPSIGLQYQITDRIGLFTEGAFYFTLYYNNETFKSKDNPLSDFKKQIIGFTDRFSLPGNLVLFYRLN